jgi:2-polyprenyl-3-methyl-5-hydroxy-6-metoxy-1,4-benzoquinol methylase
MTQTKDHYSYRIYADAKVAREFDADRFGGKIGEWIRESQERAVFSNLPPVTGWKVIDVGAGTGRFTIPFLEAGAEVTACDASSEMLKVLEAKRSDPKLHVNIVDAHELPFADQSFQCALAFRILLHVVNWRKALAELCRVSSDWLVFDMPPQHGFLRLAPVWHSVRRRFSSNVQSYRTFRHKEIREQLRDCSFEIVTIDPGFFLPLAIHRLIRSIQFTRFSESLFARLGLTRLAGSPFTIIARRRK